MEITKKMQRVIADIEYLIGSECYNPNSYDGWNDIEGRAFRYPINIPDKDGKFFKIRSTIYATPYLWDDDITPETLEKMKYRFGSNELFIGKGIISVLQYLEERYGLDFAAMEEDRKRI